MEKVNIKEINKIKSTKLREKKFEEELKKHKKDYSLMYAYAKFLYSLNRKKDNNKLNFLLNEVMHKSDDTSLVISAKRKKAQFFQSIEKYDDAENLLLEILEKDPTNYKCINTLGKLELKILNVEKAKALFKMSLHAEERTIRTDAYESLINIYILDKDYDRALNVVNQLLEDEKAKAYDKFIHFSLAQIYRGKKEYEKAYSHMEKVPSLSSRYGNVALEKVRLYSETNDGEKLSIAIQDLRLYNALEDKIDIAYELMLLAQKNGNDEEIDKQKNKFLSLRNQYKHHNNDHFQ